MLLKVTVEQNGVMLSQSIVEIDDDESLSTAVKAAVENKTELDALVAYLQSLGKFAPKE